MNKKSRKAAHKHRKNRQRMKTRAKERRTAGKMRSA